MTRLKTVLMAAITAWLLAGCSKDQIFSDPNSGTVRELGFDWNTEYSACLESDDQDGLWCGTALWLDGERVVLELPSKDPAHSPSGDVLLKKSNGIQTILYRYIPVSKSVIFYMEEGEVTLTWKEQGRCFKGDVFDADFLTICRGSADV